MSRWTILITDHQVYFKCKNAVWAEDVIMETEELSKSVRRRSSPFAWVADKENTTKLSQELEGGMMIWLRRRFGERPEKQPKLGLFPNYAATIEAYTARNVTRSEDVLNAIGGVLRTLQPCVGDFYEGLPCNHFRRALLWRPDVSSCVTRRARSGPSWSWAGWEFRKGCRWNYVDLGVTKSCAEHQDLASRSQNLGFDMRLSGHPMAIVTTSRRLILSSQHRKFPRSTSLSPRSIERYRTVLQVQTAVVTFSIRPVFSCHSLLAVPINEQRHGVQYIFDDNERRVGELFAPISMIRPENSLQRDFLIMSWGRNVIDREAVDRH